ncbi:unnamed protein product [Angiostrongylus costaricensis]|uniref:Phospholipid scramblase n=1 Tax=Angiostrongylus costaricensis TaxID=334426 RepID=A0A0R3PV02_ANGCS|nr:unnamed protein product [Angiostrongylus costaricensis]
MAHQLLKDCRINPSAPSFQLGIDEFADLATGYEEQCRRMPGLFLYDYIKPKRTVEMLAQKPGALPPENRYHLEKMPAMGVRLRDADLAIWVPIPPPMEGVPQGLEYLTMVNKIMVHQLQIGTVQQRGAFCANLLDLKDANDAAILDINGLCCCLLLGCHDKEFPVNTPNDDTIGSITKKWSGCIWETFTDTDVFSVTFPTDLDVKAKAILLGAPSLSLVSRSKINL